MVALRCEKYSERPQLGQVLQSKDNEVTIKWMMERGRASGRCTRTKMEGTLWLGLKPYP